MTVLRRYASLILAGLLLHIMIAPPHIISAQSGGNVRAETDARLMAKVKADIASFNFKSDARVKVKLRDGKKLKGYVSDAGDEKFTITDPKTNNTTTIPYADVVEVTRQKRLLPVRAILIGAGVAFAAMFVVGIARNGIGDL